MRLVEALGKVESGGATLLLEYGAMYIPIHTPVVLHLNGTTNTPLVMHFASKILIPQMLAGSCARWYSEVIREFNFGSCSRPVVHAYVQILL